MSSTKLFSKYFGKENHSVDMKHPNMENFFNELNAECLREDKQKNCKHIFVYKIMFDHTGKNICEKCGLITEQ